MALRPTFLATGGMTSEQGGKLGIGKCKGVYCEFENQQGIAPQPITISLINILFQSLVITFNKNPFTVTLIATNKANTGMLLALEDAFDLHRLTDLLN